MGLPTARAVCECNASGPPIQQTFECYISAKDLLPSCKPVLKAAIKPRCGPRRMLITILFLIAIVAVVYLLSLSGQRVQTLGRRMMPSQNVPVQTSQNSFYAFQQPTMATQQMQTNPNVPFPTNLQDTFKQPFYQLHQADVFMANHQYPPNVIPPRSACPPFFQPPVNLPAPVQAQPNYGQLPQNVLDQIRNCVSSAAPIFILPGGCHHSSNQQQANLASQGGGVTQQTGQSTGFNCPPSFYPYPVPVPVFDSLAGQSRSRDGTRLVCTCCQKRGQDSLDWKNHPVGCRCNVDEPEEHLCTPSNDGTVCSKRNCPVSISLQSLASQLLSLPGIISCATTRLILRKVPGSNITNTMEDTMDKAQKSISGLTKDQLLTESRNAQQVNALINLHMTTNPPVNIIPLLTLLQLKVNVLKALVESLINKKVMECQGYGYEVETSGPIDPCVLTAKTSAELRQLLSALRQKECDERVNANFSPYHSQRVIAESRLNTVQAKIRQVEAEFDRRRCVSVPAPTLTSRVIQQFAESTCTFGYAHANIFEPYAQGGPFESPDPFAQHLRNPKRLYLKPREAEQRPWPVRERDQAVGTAEDGEPPCKDTGTGEGNVNSSAEKAVESRSSVGDCSCGDSSSEESLDGDKKKLRLRIDRDGTVRISSLGCLRDVSLMKFVPNVRPEAEDASGRDRRVEDVERESVEDRESKETRMEVDKGVGRNGEQARDSEDKLRDIGGEDNGGGGGMVEEEQTSEDEDSEDEDENGDDDDHDDDDDDDGHGGTLGRTTGSPRLDIKKESDSTADSTREVKVKKEPKSPRKSRTLNSKDVRIKKEPGNDDKDKGIKTLDSTEMEEEEISDGLILVTKKAIVIELDTPEASDTELLLNQVDLEKRDDKVAWKRSESSSVSTETVLPGRDNGGESEGNSTGENVSRDREIDTEREPRSADAQGVVSEVRLAPARKNVAEEQQQAKKIDSSERVIDPEDGASSKNDKAKKNVQFVSMMTRVDYDRRFEEFWEWNTKNREISIGDRTGNRCGQDGGNDATGDSLAEEKDSFRMSTTRQGGGKRNVLREMFSKNCRINDGKTTSGIGRFPPAQHRVRKATGTTTTRISENVFHQKEIESGCLESIRDGSSSYESDSETGNGIVSAIYSIIENRLVSASSFLANIPNPLSVIRNLRFNKSLPDSDSNNNNNNNNKNDSFVERRTFEDSKNKKVLSEKRDWMLLPSYGDACVGVEYDSSAGSGVPVGVELVRTRKIKHSIIVDKERGKYSLVRGSSSVQFRVLSRSGFTGPRETRRSLLVRSRLRNPEYSGRGHLCPLTVLRRAKRSRMFVSRTERREDHESRIGDKFSILPKIVEDATLSRTTDSSDQTEKFNISENGQGTGEFPKLSRNEMTEGCSDRNDNNNNRAIFIEDHSSDENERVVSLRSVE